MKQNGNKYDQWRAYGQAKTANMLFSVHLAEKLGSKGLSTFSLHPGVIWTNLARHTSDEGFKELGTHPARPFFFIHKENREAVGSSYKFRQC